MNYVGTNDNISICKIVWKKKNPFLALETDIFFITISIKFIHFCQQKMGVEI